MQAWDLLLDPDGRLWAATEQGLVSVDPASGELRRSALREPARSLLRRGDGLLVGAIHGLFLLSGGGLRELAPADGGSLGYVYTLTGGSDGEVWIGTLGRGLWRLGPGGDLRRSEWPGMLPDSNIYSIALGPDGKRAVSQDQAVLFLPGDGTEGFELRSEGPNWALQFDRDGVLWIGGSHGLQAVDPETAGQLSRITDGAGLAGPEFTTSRSLLAAPDGSLVCGLDGGATLIRPAALARLPALPRPVLVGVEDGNGRSLDPGGEDLVLTQGTWSLVVRLATPWFLDERSVGFRYRMLGFDDRWSDLPAGTPIRFTSLPVGRYSLETQAFSSLTGSSPVATLLHLRVVRPWWWLPALAAGILLVAVLGALLPWLRARALRRRSQRLQALIQERTEELAKALDDMERLALEDRLTGLPNRRRFHQEAERMASRAQRTGQDFSLIVTDVDHFKRVNDRWGHVVGDQVLQEVAGRLAAAARQTDLVCRYGGDEFVALGWNSGGAVHLLAQRMRDATSATPVRLENGEHYVLRLSFGVCSWIEVGRDLDRLLRCADQALYAAKQRGLGVVCWTPDLDSGTVETA
jgi:diguanylate cyclase (GGDEF)-like protein